MVSYKELLFALATNHVLSRFGVSFFFSLAWRVNDDRWEMWKLIQIERKIVHEIVSEKRVVKWNSKAHKAIIVFGFKRVREIKAKIFQR